VTRASHSGLANFLRINIYLTQKIDDDMLWNITVNDAGAAYDPLTLLRSRTTFGRPNWMAIYGGLKTSIEAGEYLPGSQSQLKARVGVSMVLSPVPFMLITLYRLISVGLMVLPK
jgi:hypothetical protein